MVNSLINVLGQEVAWQQDVDSWTQTLIIKEHDHEWVVACVRFL